MMWMWMATTSMAGAPLAYVPVDALARVVWPEVVGASEWMWPTTGSLTSLYGPRWARAHRGLDVGAPTGTAVVAALGGWVSWVGTKGDYGLMVELEHGQGWSTRYAHLEQVDVELGEQLAAGELLGGVGATGNATGPHLHFEVRHHRVAVDPLEVLP